MNKVSLVETARLRFPRDVPWFRSVSARWHSVYFRIDTVDYDWSDDTGYHIVEVKVYAEPSVYDNIIRGGSCTAQSCSSAS